MLHQEFDFFSHFNLHPIHRKDCNSKLKCAACNVMYEKSYWSNTERKNHPRTQATKLVCKSCRQNGYNPDDVKEYTCQVCNQQYGWKKFDSQMISHFKYNAQPKLQCKECVSQLTEKLKNLHSALKKSKRNCTCKCLFHKEKCPLAPCYHGETRWPGSDGRITAEERQFLDKLNPQPHWWAKAWGQQ